MNTTHNDKRLIQTSVSHSQVKGVTRHIFNTITDHRGSLSVGEFEREVPFIPKRYFLVFDAPVDEKRGEHAHLQCKQFLIATRGSISVSVDDGKIKEEFILDHPYQGLYVPAMTWSVQYRYSPDAVLLVLASEYYDPDDYIRNYAAFVQLAEEKCCE